MATHCSRILEDESEMNGQDFSQSTTVAPVTPGWANLGGNLCVILSLVVVVYIAPTVRIPRKMLIFH